MTRIQPPLGGPGSVETTLPPVNSAALQAPTQANPPAQTPVGNLPAAPDQFDGSSFVSVPAGDPGSMRMPEGFPVTGPQQKPGRQKGAGLPLNPIGGGGFIPAKAVNQHEQAHQGRAPKGQPLPGMVPKGADPKGAIQNGGGIQLPGLPGVPKQSQANPSKGIQSGAIAPQPNNAIKPELPE